MKVLLVLVDSNAVCEGLNNPYCGHVNISEPVRNDPKSVGSMASYTCYNNKNSISRRCIQPGVWTELNTNAVSLKWNNLLALIDYVTRVV